MPSPSRSSFFPTTKCFAISMIIALVCFEAFFIISSFQDLSFAHSYMQLRHEHDHDAHNIYDDVDVTKEVGYLNDSTKDSHIIMMDSKNKTQHVVEKRTNIDHQTTTQKVKRPLQFLHIPKNAGSAVTESGIKANILWGYCNFHKCSLDYNKYDKDHRVRNAIDKLPQLKLNDTNQYLWHYPPSLLRQIINEKIQEQPLKEKENLLQDNNNLKGDDNGILESHASNQFDPYLTSDLFAVIRSPYDRLLSAYYHWETMHHDLGQSNSAGLMNRLISESLDAVELDILYRGGHYIPQYMFVYDVPTATHTILNKRKIVQHVLHFENITSEFNELMNQYYEHDSVSLLNSKASKRKRHIKATLTKFDIDVENRKRINQFYANDFKAFGFEMMD